MLPRLTRGVEVGAIFGQLCFQIRDLRFGGGAPVQRARQICGFTIERGFGLFQTRTGALQIRVALFEGRIEVREFALEVAAQKKQFEQPHDEHTEQKGGKDYEPGGLRHELFHVVLLFVGSACHDQCDVRRRQCREKIRAAQTFKLARRICRARLRFVPDSNGRSANPRRAV